MKNKLIFDTQEVKNVERRILTDEQAKEVSGNAIAITTVIAYMSIAILTSVAYRLYASGTGKVQLPGGYSFNWGL